MSDFHRVGREADHRIPARASPSSEPVEMQNRPTINELLRYSVIRKRIPKFLTTGAVAFHALCFRCDFFIYLFFPIPIPPPLLTVRWC